jgi:putative acetyltransferase
LAKNSGENLRIERVVSATDDARALITELEAELSAEYPPENRHGLNLDRLFRPEVAFFIAYRDGEPMGCGGIAFENQLAELKRMYVRPWARGSGVGDAILERLSEEARSRGFARLVLETGDAQGLAMRFYQRNGFVRCGAFGQYAAMPAHGVLRSVFFEKEI